MPTCLVALGSNLGDRRQLLDRAVELLGSQPAIEVVASSGWHATRPIGGPAGQAMFLNGAVRLRTGLAPAALLAVLRRIERQLGRMTGLRWAPRTLDLDLLLYGRRVIGTSDLVVPHPRMAFRRFVLAPAAEVAADLTHPVIGWTVGRLLRHLDTAADYVAISGPPGAGKTWLAEQLHARFGGPLIRQSTPGPLPTAPTLDRSGHAYAAEIRFLTCRAEQLDRRSLAGGGAHGRQVTAGSIVVSDFWFDQSLAYAGHWLDGETCGRFQVAWQDAARRVVRPKLVVVVGLSPPWAACRAGWPVGPPSDRQRLWQSLADFHARRGHGPMLWLAGGSREEMVSEAIAAVQAMR